MFSLRVQRGTGYTKKFFDEDWSIIDLSFSSNHPIPELKVRVITLGDTVQVLSVNQQGMALEIEKTNEELVKVDNKVMSTIYSDGERVVKVFKKTAGWNAIPQDVMVQQFSEYLGNLQTRARPAIEPIKPRSGKNPFLKVTFISDGEKREFSRLNKSLTNNYETSRLTPMCRKNRKIWVFRG